MAQRDLPDMVRIAGVGDCDADLAEDCEKKFCKAAKAKDKVYGSQIDKDTRDVDRYKALLEQAWAGKRPPSSGAWEESAEDATNVGFDMDRGGPSTKYRVKTTVTTGGKLFTETHLFPEN
jgi:hypothetical protein